MTSNPALILAKAVSGAKGTTTARAARAGMMAMTGPRKNRPLLAAGLDHFLGKQLQTVGNGLQQAQGTNPVGSKTRLHETQQLAFPQGEVSDLPHQRRQQKRS